MKNRLLCTCCTLQVVACFPPAPVHPYAGELPAGVHLDMEGAFELSPDGALQLTLVHPCSMDVPREGDVPTTIRCGLARVKQIHVVARSPWGKDVEGTWATATQIVFRPDWGAGGLDPLASDALALASQPWSVSGTQWTPSSEEATAIVQLVARATDTETVLVRDEAAPRLEVTSFEFEGGTLRSGESATLTVSIANRGPGTAYRVTASTLSGVEMLHGRHLSFGMIKPGAEKVRKLTLSLPDTVAERDTMLVLQLHEGNGHGLPDINRRIPIAPSIAAPQLLARCAIVGLHVEVPELHMGQNLTIRCMVENRGKVAASQVGVEATFGTGQVYRAVGKPVAAAGNLGFDVPIVVPSGLPLDAKVEIAIAVRDGASTAVASTKIVAVMRKPRICQAGQLTRAQYQAKAAQLRAVVASGGMTQAQFDRYDAELLTCLK